MAYTALQKMKKWNESRFGKAVGPVQPERHYDSVSQVESGETSPDSRPLTLSPDSLTLNLHLNQTNHRRRGTV